MKLLRIFALLGIFASISMNSFSQDLSFYTIGDTTKGSVLIDFLQDNYSVSNPRGYSGIRQEMYRLNGIDNNNGTVVGIYTGYTVTGVNGTPNESATSINTEHSWPQGKFDSHEPMRGDAHHLFPSYNRANSARGNNPFAEINDNTTDKWWIDNGYETSIPSANVIDNYSESTISAFEPRESVKGNIARAIFYMWTIYQDRSEFSDDESFFEGMKETLFTWHMNDPVDQAEWDRSLAIEGVQGNINPFVQDSSLVRRAYFPGIVVNPGDTTGNGNGGDDEFVLLSKNFDNDAEATDGGWTEVAIQGTNRWTVKSFQNDTYGEIRAYMGSGQDPEEVENWFISPVLDFDSLDAEVLTFKSLTAFNPEDMKIRVFWKSGAFDSENMNTEDWNELSPTLDPHRGDNYGTFTESGELDLSAATDSGYIAFYYHNTDGSGTTWQIDDIKIAGVEADTTGNEEPEDGPLFSRDFEGDTDITDGGWTEISVQGNNTWRVLTYQENMYGQINAYTGTGAEEVENWLITPAINFDSLDAEILTFRSKTGYNTGNMLLRVFWKSGDFDAENIDIADWTELNPTLDSFRGDGYGEFTESGELDLSMVEGTGYIAFYYHNTDGSTTTWQIDDVTITGTPFTIGINEEEWTSERPSDIELLQNYPNPFNPTTTLSFSLPATQFVTLQVFDINGRLIQTLVNGVTSEGLHQVSFDASNLSSGLYLYRLTTADQSFISKMTLLK